MEMIRIALVLGGAGDVGEGIVRQLRAAGWNTIVPSRSADKLDALAAASNGPGTFHPVVADVGSETGAADAADAIAARHGSIDLIVASVGGWWSGPPLMRMDVDDWYSVLEGSLSSHFHAARAFLPLVLGNPESQYVFINGGAARMPVPGSGPISIAAAAQEMLQRVVAAESASGSANIYTLLLNSLILTRARTSAPPGSISADDVGGKIISLFENRPQHGATVMLNSTADL